MNRTLALIPALAAALLLSGCDKAVDATLGAGVKGYLMRNPEVLREVSQALAQKEAAESEKTAAAEHQETLKSLGRLRNQIERDPRDFVLNPAGRITVVEFFDYKCGYCKMIAPEIVRMAAENPDVRFVFKEFPIFGEVSDTAARVALTPQAKAKGLQLYNALMAEEALDEASLDRILTSLGIDPAQARRDAASPEVVKHVADVRGLAQALNLKGTPAFVVGNDYINAADLEWVKAAIAKARSGGAGPLAPKA